MSFIRTDILPNGQIRYYLVENYRIDGKTKQRRIKYLGTEIHGYNTRKYKKQQALLQQERASNIEAGASLLFIILLQEAPAKV